MTIFQKRENEQFTPPASLSSAPAVVNSFVTIVCMDSATPYIFIHSKNMGIIINHITARMVCYIGFCCFLH